MLRIRFTQESQNRVRSGHLVEPGIGGSPFHKIGDVVLTGFVLVTGCSADEMWRIFCVTRDQVCVIDTLAKSVAEILGGNVALILAKADKGFGSCGGFRSILCHGCGRADQGQAGRGE